MKKYFLDFPLTSVAINCITYLSSETERKNSMHFRNYVQKSKNCLYGPHRSCCSLVMSHLPIVPTLGQKGGSGKGQRRLHNII